MDDSYLFKVKRLDNRKWVVGFYAYIHKKHYIYTGQLIHTGLYDIAERFEIDPSTICRCTGLKDKNNKLIWENDVIDRKEPYPEIVKYKDGDWTLDYSYAHNMKAGNAYCNLGFYAQERKCVEVIGNIFDNPELLMSNAEALNQYIKELFDYLDGKNDDFEPIPISKEIDDEMQKDSFY